MTYGVPQPFLSILFAHRSHTHATATKSRHAVYDSNQSLMTPPPKCTECATPNHIEGGSEHPVLLHLPFFPFPFRSRPLFFPIYHSDTFPSRSYRQPFFPFSLLFIQASNRPWLPTLSIQIHVPSPLARGFDLSVMFPPVLASTSFASPCSSEYPAPLPCSSPFTNNFPHIPISARADTNRFSLVSLFLLVLLGFLFLVSVSTTIFPPLPPPPPRTP
jgi:hypothetical protein